VPPVLTELKTARLPQPDLSVVHHGRSSAWSSTARFVSDLPCADCAVEATGNTAVEARNEPGPDRRAEVGLHCSLSVRLRFRVTTTTILVPSLRERQLHHDDYSLLTLSRQLHHDDEYYTLHRSRRCRRTHGWRLEVRVRLGRTRPAVSPGMKQHQITLPGDDAVLGLLFVESADQRSAEAPLNAPYDQAFGHMRVSVPT
jgi:hypothetical protein